MKCAFIDLGKHFGGAEKYLLTIIQRWIEQGNEAVLIVKRGSLFESKLRDTDLNTILLSVDISLTDANKTRKYLKNAKVNIINVHGINSGVFLKLCRLTIPYVTTVHSNAEIDRVDKSNIIRKIFVCLENFCLKKSKQIIVVSEVIKDLLINRGIDAKKIIVIHNGVKCIEYNDKKQRTQRNEKMNICFVGRLEKVKGCEYLIRALSEIKNLNWFCDIYGEGSQEKSLRLLVENFEMKDRIIFKGFSNSIRKELTKYDVLVLPSLFEAFPLTIPEAMNARLLLVCSKAGGITRIIRDGENGYLFAKQDYKMLASLLQSIYENPLSQNIIIENAYQEFKRKYTEDIMINKTFSIFQNICCGGMK